MLTDCKNPLVFISGFFIVVILINYTGALFKRAASAEPGVPDFIRLVPTSAAS
jgi:hypothetical protein